MNKKKCANCGKKYPADKDHFGTDNSTKDGLNRYCRTCCTIRRHKYEDARRGGRRLRRTFEYPTSKFVHKPRKKRTKEEIRRNDRISRANNIEAERKYEREYQAKRRKNPKHKLASTISGAIRHSLKSGKGGRPWESLVGYTLDDLMLHLELQFEDGMTWSNHGRGKGKWQIDHIRPVSDFNLISPEDPDFKVCWSLWNLQPLWAEENIRKKDKCEAPPLPLRN